MDAFAIRLVGTAKIPTVCGVFLNSVPGFRVRLVDLRQNTAGWREAQKISAGSDYSGTRIAPSRLRLMCRDNPSMKRWLALGNLRVTVRLGRQTTRLGRSSLVFFSETLVLFSHTCLPQQPHRHAYHSTAASPRAGRGELSFF